MDTLVAVGSSAAILYGVYAIIRIAQGLAAGDMELVAQYHMDLYFESAGTILTLVSVGKYWEARSKSHTADALQKLMALAPATAHLLRDGKEEEVPLEEVRQGDLLIVRAGEAIPVDGTVTEGQAAIDESAITGESMPVDKSIGDPVTGATLCRSGYFTMQATHVGEETTLSQIIRLVEDAAATKAPIQRIADKVAAVFVPVVIGIAVLAMVIWLLVGQTARLCSFHRHCGAGHQLSLRLGVGPPHCYYGGYRPRCRIRHPGEKRRSTGARPQYYHRRAG